MLFFRGGGAQVNGNTDESQAVELSDGTLMLNCRSNRGRGCRYVALSRDGGQTWIEEKDDPVSAGIGGKPEHSLIRTVESEATLRG